MFENTLGRKKREELGDQILMKQMHGFKSAECCCSTLGVIAGSKDSLAEAQSCSWKPPGATKPKALAKPPCCFFLQPHYLSCVWCGSQGSVPSCSSLGQGGLVLKGPLSIPGFFGRCICYCTSQLKLTGFVKFKGLMSFLQLRS